MASAFGHAAMAMTLGRWQQPQLKKLNFWLWWTWCWFFYSTITRTLFFPTPSY